MSDRLKIEGWSNSELGEIADQITKGTTPTTAGFEYLSSGIPFVKVENIDSFGVNLNSITQFISSDAHEALKRSQFQCNDILFSIAGTIGKTALIIKEHVPCNTNQAVAIIRGTSKAFHPSFLRYQLNNSVRDIIEKNARGGAMNNISLGDLKSFDVLVAPLPEQKRIADKLDTVLARVDACRERLNRIPLILKRFKQSVLAAATSGKLTEDWRSSASAENINEYVEHLKKIRFSDWQKSQLESDRKGKYIDPKPELNCDKPDIPENWLYISLSSLSTRVTYGLTTRPAYVQVGVPVISAKEIKHGKVNYELASRISEMDYSLQREKCKIFFGDVIFSKTGSIGHVAIADKKIPCCCSQNIAVITPLISGKYLEIVLRSSYIQDLAKQSSSGNAIPDLQLGVLSGFPIPLPSETEQQEIVRRVETLFAFADRLEARLTTARNATERLTPALLAKAFRGELVPQDPDDEPASALLARLSASANDKAGKAKGAGSKTKAPASTSKAGKNK